jgi:alpha-L-fucosidase
MIIMQLQQRLSTEKLKEFEKMQYGMFLHFGMSTFTGKEYDDGTAPAAVYAPDQVDVAQWVETAKLAGMKYAVLTAKHVAGHCLWPSKCTDYTVENSTNKTDVVGAFVEECRRQGIVPCLYYCSWDNHTKLGSRMPFDSVLEDGQKAFTTDEYQAYMSQQLNELLTWYGKLGVIWIDIPFLLGRTYRTRLYREITQLQPDILVMMNHGIGDSTNYDTRIAWPSDLIPIESSLPTSFGGYAKIRRIEGADYYIPGEVCDTIGHSWFWRENDTLRSDRELLGMYLVATQRGANFLLDVPPDRSGRIPEDSVEALLRLRKNIELN